ncbi:hypothetical protein GXW74_19000 [Roseomonas eburnea]|uniref:Uncharacterized protein n=1 Tax=Neoroseomonas eburnea TaxID=1346889 RepID=A0A9X9XFV2_9PROT|nr:hypothetical protein [Neoroseomonas eburnea]MBR0682588.1 hypothetical protein [Neoroseomonas eburnea]
MVALAWTASAPVDTAEAIDRTAGSDARIREAAAAEVPAALPGEAVARDAAREGGPATGIVVAVLLAVPLWGLVIGLGVAILAAP